MGFDECFRKERSVGKCPSQRGKSTSLLCGIFFLGESPSVPAAEVSAHSAVGGNEKGEFLGQEREGRGEGKGLSFLSPPPPVSFVPFPSLRFPLLESGYLGLFSFERGGDVGRGTCGWRR